MKKLLVVASVGIAVLFSGCTYKHATINYKPYNAYSESEGGNIKYKEVGPVHACSSGFVWDDCGVLAQQTLRKMQEQAKILGGDAVVGVKWYYKDFFVLTPTCEERLGWFALYILPGFGPWVQNACAEGSAVKILDKNQNKGQ